ncbi:MAG: hypothetical protein CXT73_05860 [Methanobacteriota archaeon]|nr:MAG: hypothetical protein CXT73_05860 [Euryarchaeota archaeon]
MKKSKRKNYKELLEKKNHTIVEGIIDKVKIEKLKQKIKDLLKKYEFDDGNNPYVTNTKRESYSMYSNQVEHYRMSGASEEYIKKMEDKYDEVYEEMLMDLEDELKSIFYLIRVPYWRIIGVTLMKIYEGSREQEIHHDAPEGMNRIFLTIPLVCTSLEMGPTIFYDEEEIKDYRKEDNKLKKGLPDLPKGSFETKIPSKSTSYGNIGFLKDLIPYWKKKFEMGRKQYELKEGDVTIHKDITYHSGGENKTKETREFLFIVCDYTEKLNVKN